MSGKPKRKKGADDEELLALIDPCAVERAIEVIKDWSALPDQQYTREDADTVERLLLNPLEKWLESLPPNCVEMQAGQALAECLTNDIAYGFRYRQKVSAAQLARLETLWSEFQRVVGVGSVLHEQQRSARESKRKSKIASKPRSKVTKEQIEKAKAAFVESKRLAGIEKPEWGWKTAVCKKLLIDMATLRTRIQEE